MDIREELRKIRKYNEISVRQLSEELNISKNTIQSMENKRMMPNIKTVMKIAEKFGYNLKLEKINEK